MQAEGTGERLTELMRAALDGDAAAYARLLKEVTPIIRRLAKSRSTGSADAEDMVQDVLLSLHAVRRTYDPARPLMPWLMVIARHRVADFQRRQVRQKRNEVAVDVLPETSSEDRTNISNSAPGDPEELLRAIAGLPPGQRQAVELLKLREMSLKEASAASGMSVAALKVAMHRAMKFLRTVLSH
ncbi:MAG: sigma-70 family RNA polymerase sigma factor [Proteobacteria bacterium]|nr:sigma-70 family RNA polymerase sigma factor [Pseudomonadota bacterium]